MSRRNVASVNSALARTLKPLPQHTHPNAVVIGDGLENLVAGLGNWRDKRSYTNYTMPRILTRFDLDNMFRGAWLPKRIVTKPADAMTNKWRTFTFSDDDENPNIEALEKEEKRFDVQGKFNEAMYWARLYGGAVMVLGMRDVMSAADMLKPLDYTKVRKGDLRFIHVLDRWRIAPTGRMDTDLSSPNFGLPLSYMIAESSVEVHWTRVLRFNGQKLPYFSWLSNGMWDDSELQHVYDSLVNYDTSTASIASMLFEANVDVVQSKGLTTLLSTKEGEAKLAKRFQLGQMMKSFNRTLVLDGEETYDKKQNSFANVDKIWGQFMVDVAGASHMPVSILFGDQTGSGLDSGGDDDRSNWHNYVADERSAKLQRQLDAFDQVFVRHTIGSYPDDYASVWNPLGETDETQQAAIQYQRSQRDQIYLTTGVVTEGLVASQLKADGTYQSMSSEDVKLAEELSASKDDLESTQSDIEVQKGGLEVEHSKVALQSAKKELTAPAATKEK